MLAANRGGAGGEDVDDDGPRWLSESEREELAEPVVRVLLAMSQFRAEKPGGGRFRFAQQHLPADLDERVTHTAVRLACDRADEAARQRYADIDGHYDQLAADLLTDPAYQRAGSAAARKQAAERFLTTWADGWSPPPVAREELYARAQRLATPTGAVLTWRYPKLLLVLADVGEEEQHQDQAEPEVSDRVQAVVAAYRLPASLVGTDERHDASVIGSLLNDTTGYHTVPTTSPTEDQRRGCWSATE
ncbi:hypothetical protein OOK41_13540 [Micromonospora sp. NBC_01655]|uniref:hypothetical protein n=1 Tax=Micromonospora sp. NBC_01655 TaxID=2975983 RepID=UPI0022530F7C|nr:hypothetical protein [Micromonospora sp. NBC_01655]MCX4471323.1 hypothetical protein [Micromonospora sp. NBC_01655]